MTDQTRRTTDDFERILQATVQKLTASRGPVTESKRIRLTIHRSASGRIQVELETKH
jgi:hypothetical protein